jgi:hypothetical protein
VPPQLLAACAKLAPGAPCTVRFQDKALAGVCQELPDHSHACLPAKPGRAGKVPRSTHADKDAPPKPKKPSP